MSLSKLPAAATIVIVTPYDAVLHRCCPYSRRASLPEYRVVCEMPDPSTHLALLSFQVITPDMRGYIVADDVSSVLLISAAEEGDFELWHELRQQRFAKAASQHAPGDTWMERDIILSTHRFPKTGGQIKIKVTAILMGFCPHICHGMEISCGLPVFLAQDPTRPSTSQPTLLLHNWRNHHSAREAARTAASSGAEGLQEGPGV